MPFTGAVDVDRVLAEFEAGATIVLQALHYHWPPLAEFCRALDRRLGHPVQANAYFTPRDSQGLSVHHDTHDVFVLQVAGTKRWLVYEPALALPLSDQRYAGDLEPPATPVQDVVLAPGDSLYLPRGWLHEARTSHADSLHLTVGVNVYTWLDAFKAALAECADELEYRRSVSPGSDVRARLLALLADRLEPEDVARRMHERLVRTRRPIREGQLTQLRELDRLRLETQVERRPTVIELLEETKDHVVLSFEGKRVAFPRHAAEELSYVVGASAPFRPADLSGQLDEAGKLTLVRRLVREGFLRIISAQEADAPPP